LPNDFGNNFNEHVCDRISPRSDVLPDYGTTLAALVKNSFTESLQERKYNDKNTDVKRIEYIALNSLQSVQTNSP
jgi:hypothetical protein